MQVCLLCVCKHFIILFLIDLMVMLVNTFNKWFGNFGVECVIDGGVITDKWNVY